jgi:hypothetical protein
MRAWSERNGIPGRVKLVFEDRSKEDVREVARVFTRDHLNVPAFADKSVLPLQPADLIAVIYARKIMRKANFSQVRPAYEELNKMLHSTEYLGDDLNGVWNGITALVITRPTPPGQKPGIYFQSDMSNPRKAFNKKAKRTK